MVEEYSFDPDSRAEKYMDLLINDDHLSESQEQLFLDYMDFLEERYEPTEERHSVMANLSEWIYGEEEPVMNWNYIEDEMAKFIRERIDRYDLEDFNQKNDDSKREIPQLETDHWEEDFFEVEVGPIKDTLKQDSQYDDIWLTELAFYKHEDSESKKPGVESENRMKESQARKYAEMKCDLGQEDEVQEWVKEAIDQGRKDAAIGFAEILSEYEESIEGNILELSDKQKAKKLADFLNKKSDSEFEFG